MSPSEGHARHPLWHRGLSAGHRPFSPTQHVPWNHDAPTTVGGPRGTSTTPFCFRFTGILENWRHYFLNEETEQSHSPKVVPRRTGAWASKGPEAGSEDGHSEAGPGPGAPPPHHSSRIKMHTHPT